MVFRITTSRAESIAAEVQRMMADLKIAMQRFRVSMVDADSIVEFDAVVTHSQQEAIVDRLHRQGVVTEVTPIAQL
jgi:hypothetical protein